MRTALQRLDGRLVFIEPKSERSKRTIPIPDAYLDALKAHPVRQIAERLAAGDHWQEQRLVFPSSLGTPLDPRSLARSFCPTL